MTPNSDSTPPLSVLRVYLRRRSSTPGRGFWGRLFGRALSYELADAVLLRLDGVGVSLHGVAA